MTETIGGYVRHRDRMVQQSVFEDLRDTLIACRWLAGTTTHEVMDPDTNVWGTVTTAPDDVLPLLEGNPIELIDYFPDSEDDDSNRIGEPEANKTALNTFALDNGTQGETAPRELGSNAQLVPYTFAMAFWASSDAVAQAVMNDLRDRYSGRLVRNDAISLWNFNSTSTSPVVRMDVEKFSYRLNTELNTPAEVHLYFGELLLLDEVDGA